MPRAFVRDVLLDGCGMSFHVPEKLRVRNGERGTDPSYGNNGMFFILPSPAAGRPFRIAVIASDGTDWEMSGLDLPAWEHVSVSTAVRCPTWAEMCYVKGIFWDAEDVVMQLHPRASEYVNCHPYCLHLWRPIGIEIPTPPFITVGPEVTA